MPEIQLELSLYPRGCLRESIEAYIRERAEYVAQATLTDYGERARWLYQVFGETRSLTAINYDTLRAAEREWGPRGKGYMLVTVRKRFVFLLAAMKLAAARGVIRLDQVPPLPKIASDSKRRERFLTLTEYQQLRLALCGRMRVLIDLAFWTGHHRYDLWTMQRWQIEPDYVWKDNDGKEVWRGRFWRKNTKNRRCVPCWVPLEPESLGPMREALADGGSPDGLIIGRVCNYARSLRAACDRIEIPLVSLMAMRHSIATLILERTQDYEYTRLVLAHEGHVRATPDHRYVGTGNPSTLTRHYASPSPSTMVAGVLRRQHAMGSSGYM